MIPEAGWGVGGTLGAIVLVVSGLLGACDRTEAPKKEIVDTTPVVKQLSILVDGSSTVHLLSRAILDLYASELTTDIELGVSGTGGGFKKFCAGQIQINGASRPITSLEAKACAKSGIAFVELPVAYDGIAIVVPKSNDWLTSLTTQELDSLWSAKSEGQLHSWKQVRSTFPDEPVHLYGPGLESGTFDFFNEAIVQKETGSRADYKSSENDHELAQLIAKDPQGLGYFGLAYYRKYQDQLRLVAVDDGNEENGAGAILPTPLTVGNGQYSPLSRPLFVYVEQKQLERPELLAFVQFYVKGARLVAPDVGYVGLGHEVLRLVEARLNNRKLGSVFSGVDSVVGLTIADLLQAEEDPVGSPHKVQVRAARANESR